MGGAIKEKMEKVWGWFGMDQSEDRADYDETEYDEEEQDEVEYDEPEEQEEKKIWGRRGTKVVNMPQVQPIKVVISQPTNVDQAVNICDLLKEKKSIIVNLEYVDKDTARRIIDIVYGAALALDGHIEKISKCIVLIAPVNYDVENEIVRNEAKSKISVSWVRNGNNQ